MADLVAALNEFEQRVCRAGEGVRLELFGDGSGSVVASMADNSEARLFDFCYEAQVVHFLKQTRGTLSAIKARMERRARREEARADRELQRFLRRQAS